MDLNAKIARQDHSAPLNSDHNHTILSANPDVNTASFASLHDRRLPVVQRQRIAATMGRQFGNAFLSRMLAHTIQRDDVSPAPAATGGTNTLAPTSSGLGTAVDTILNSSPQGKDALATLTQYKVKLEVNETNAPKFLPDTNVCKMNSKMGAEVTASYFIHEMYHAKMHHTGQELDAKTMDDNDENRKKFVDHYVNEEIVGTYRGVEGVLTFEASGRILVEASKKAIPCYEEYVRLYNNAFDKQTQNGKSKGDAQKAGQKSGRYAVKMLFDDPEGMAIRYKPGGGVLTYREHYGREWDRTQRNKQAAKP